jgi:muramoyltetrapeptide carboxypeptidase
LRPGGTIGVVAPAGKVDPLLLHAGIARLEGLGFKVVQGKHLEKTHRYFAGRDRERAEDLRSMLQNSAVDAVVCARGGSGTARMLPHCNFDVEYPKICVGASDITTLLLFLSAQGWVTFHGPMVATQFGGTSTPQIPQMEELFVRILAGESLDLQFPCLPLRPGRAEGILMGGCLSLLCTSIGTAWEVQTNETILFLEDTGEAPYRIDRMLSYLKGLGKFDRVLGVVFGQMPHCHPEALPEVIEDVLSDFQFPILFGFPSGHGAATATLPLGIRYRLDVERGSLKMCESAVI